MSYAADVGCCRHEPLDLDSHLHRRSKVGGAVDMKVRSHDTTSSDSNFRLERWELDS